MSDGTEESLVPCTYTRIIARELNLQERDLPTLLRGTGLHSDILLATEDSYITTMQQIRVLDNALHISGAADFGLRLGQRLHPRSHGAMGYLVLSSPDVITALESFADFLPTRLPFSSVHISLDEHWLSCTLTLKTDPKPSIRQLLQECFALMIQSVTEAIAGRKIQGTRIELAHEKPQHHQLYGNYLHSPVSFGHQTCSIFMPAGVARLANVYGNSNAYSLAQNLCLDLLSKIPSTSLSNTDRVRRQLLSAPLGNLTATDIARAMFITKRTLQRRLEREGTNYREITEKLYSELAIRHLRDPRHTVESTAALLGYFDTAAFRKAFRRWYGQSPGAYRRSV